MWSLLVTQRETDKIDRAPNDEAQSKVIVWERSFFFFLLIHRARKHSKEKSFKSFHRKCERFEFY